MVEIKIADNRSMAYVNGTTKEICAELAVAIAAIHQQLKAQDKFQAASFQKMMQTMMEPDSPVWAASIPSVAVDMSKINGK